MEYTLQNSRFTILKQPLPSPTEVAASVARFLEDKYDAEGHVSCFDARTRLGATMEIDEAVKEASNAS